jgi:hypothetical protein
MTSLSVLLTGWLGIFIGEVAALLWLANATLLLTWVLLFTAPRFALGTSLITFFLTVLFLSVDKIMINEAGHRAEIISYCPGYWLWVGSSLFLVLGTILLSVYLRNQQT